MKYHFVALFILSILIMTPFAALHAQDDVYTIPADPDGMDVEQVIARVGDVDITLGDYRDRVRFQRLLYYASIDIAVEQVGATLVELDNPNNQYAPSLQGLLDQTLSEQQFNKALYDQMILDELARQEAETRGIEATDCEVDEFWAQVVGILDPITNCEFPEGFEAGRDAFIERAQIYSGLTAEEIQQVGRSFAEGPLVFDEIANEVEAPDVRVVRTRHIRVEDLETANEVHDRLVAGEEFQTLLEEYTLETDGLEGNGGELGTFTAGQMVPPFEEAAFNAEVGEIVGPVQSDFGFHVIEVEDKAVTVSARYILLATEDEANQALRLLQGGADFASIAQQFSLDRASAAQGGALGSFTRDQAVGRFGEAFGDATFSAETGDFVGPIALETGFAIVEMTGVGDTPAAVTARHILVETEDEALDVIDRLNNGEDFNALAREVSLDPGAGGHRGDTATIMTGGSRTGFYAQDIFTADINDIIFNAEPGDILDPIETFNGFIVIEVEAFDMRPPTDAETEVVRNTHAEEWRQEQLDSDRIEQTDLWHGNAPLDPLPSSWNAAYVQLDAYLLGQSEALQAQREATTILRVLETLTVSEPEGDTGN
jgi:foldase protein PrsA